MLKSTAKSEIVINDLNSIRSHQILNGYGQLWLLWLWHICVKHSTVCLTFGPSFWLPSVYLPRCGDKMWHRRLWMSCSDQLQNPLYKFVPQHPSAVWICLIFVMFYRFSLCFACVVLRFYRILPFGFKGEELQHLPSSVRFVTYWRWSNMIEDEIKALPCTLKIQGTEGNTVTGRRKAGPAAVPARAAALRSWKQHSLTTCCTVISTWRFFRKIDARHWNKKLVRCLATPVECFDCFQCLSCTPESWRHWMSLGSHWHVGTTSTIVGVKWCKCVQAKSCMQWVRIGSCMESALILCFPLAFWTFGLEIWSEFRCESIFESSDVISIYKL